MHLQAQWLVGSSCAWSTHRMRRIRFARSEWPWSDVRWTASEWCDARSARCGRRRRCDGTTERASARARASARWSAAQGRRRKIGEMACRQNFAARWACHCRYARHASAAPIRPCRCATASTAATSRLERRRRATTTTNACVVCLSALPSACVQRLIAEAAAAAERQQFARWARVKTPSKTNGEYKAVSCRLKQDVKDV